ncbi:MAG: GDYXXLXY domain-containing protein [Castellaniella sp.]|uniref:GDYXXLXY domain-containing protein n=1 Tax=Castellaniella sp. TaxID=1955812 RepID=UPI003A862EDE
MQVVSLASPAHEADSWRRHLVTGLGSLAVVLAGAALVFWVAANWPRMTPDARLTGVQGTLALLVVLVAVLARRGSRWAGPLAGLAALATGALLALMGQIYQTGADTWELFLTWAVLMLPWLVAIRSAFLALLWVVLLNLALRLFIDSLPFDWSAPLPSIPVEILSLGLNGLLLVLAECLLPMLRDPWRLVRRVLAGATLFWAVWGVLVSVGWLTSDDLNLQALSLVFLPRWAPILVVYGVYTRWRRDPVVVAMALLAGILMAEFMVIPWFDVWEQPEIMLLIQALLILLLGFWAARRLLRLRSAMSLPAPAHPALAEREDAELVPAAGRIDATRTPWYVTALRIGFLVPGLLLLGGWVVVSFELDSFFDALVAGLILMVSGLWLGRTAGPAFWREVGAVLAILGVLLAGVIGLWLMADATGWEIPLLILLTSGAVAYAGARQFIVRLAVAGVTLSMGYWLLVPEDFLFAFGDSPEVFRAGGLSQILLLLVGAAAWVRSMTPARWARWRPLAWAALSVAAFRAILLSLLAQEFILSRTWPILAALLVSALLPGLLLGGWMSTIRPALPVRLRLGVPAACCVAGPGWMFSPVCSVALTGLVLGRWAHHRPAQGLSVLLGLGGLVLYYFDIQSGTLIGKATTLGLTAIWLFMLALWLWVRWRWSTGSVRPVVRRHWALPVWLLAGGVLTLGVVQARVHHYQTILSQGQPVLLALAPVDPRSLMQGDYMDLDYAVRRQVDVWLNSEAGLPLQFELKAAGHGWLLLRPDAQGVGQLAGVSVEKPPALSDDHVALAVRWRDGRLDWGARNWFFPEGQGDRYAKARYGRLRVAKDGTALLSGLLDEQQSPL